MISRRMLRTATASANLALQLTSFVGRPSASLWRSQLNAGTLIWNDPSSSSRGFGSPSDSLVAVVVSSEGS
jgi:hypothetical protein